MVLFRFVDTDVIGRMNPDPGRQKWTQNEKLLCSAELNTEYGILSRDFCYRAWISFKEGRNTNMH